MRIIEIGVPISGEYDPDQIDEEGVMCDHMVVLNCIFDMLANNSNAKYKDICDATTVPLNI